MSPAFSNTLSDASPIVLTKGNVDYLIPHQANIRIIDSA
ncbi:MAG TPA: hypothetical protein EYP16_03065, partial [Candidatus Atribacteria bacterium]|nr:hypothetical protein [Candidatus Atribacteria bacterium]